MLLSLDNRGSVVLLEPMDRETAEWLVVNVSQAPWQWYGPALAVEPSCVAAILDGYMEDGGEVFKSADFEANAIRTLGAILPPNGGR